MEHGEAATDAEADDMGRAAEIVDRGVQFRQMIVEGGMRRIRAGVDPVRHEDAAALGCAQRLNEGVATHQVDEASIMRREGCHDQGRQSAGPALAEGAQAHRPIGFNDTVFADEKSSFGTRPIQAFLELAQPVSRMGGGQWSGTVGGAAVADGFIHVKFLEKTHF